mmetsp:Transcript_6311/g.9527  ORF Transcript_6311/g.9527 Transcript_6311/m.9527 type:complete len:99 (+) Transcript_6311:79-375(+)
MDYRGQRLSEIMYYIITILFGVIAWIYGYIHSDFKLTVYGWFAGLCLAILLCVPDWPYFNRNKVEWLDELPSRSEGNADESSKSEKARKKRRTTKKKD